MSGSWIGTSTEEEMRRGTASTWTLKVRLRGRGKRSWRSPMWTSQMLHVQQSCHAEGGVVYLGTDPEAKEVYSETIGLKIFSYKALCLPGS